jgi:hypothetical protein
VLGAELWSFRRATSILNHWDISLTLIHYILKVLFLVIHLSKIICSAISENVVRGIQFESQNSGNSVVPRQLGLCRDPVSKKKKKKKKEEEGWQWWCLACPGLPARTT